MRKRETQPGGDAEPNADLEGDHKNHSFPRRHRVPYPSDPLLKMELGQMV